MANYGQPRRFNVVTAFMLLAMMAAGYWFWRFFPVYFDGWNVDHVLMEAATATYRLNRLTEPERTKELTALVEKTKADIIKQGEVTDPDLSVNLDIDGDNVAVSADYTAIVTHPGITATTTLHFHKSEHADIKKVKWD
jgi:hypothetical protein